MTLTMNSYMRSFAKKLDHFFDHQEISNLVYLHDEDDNARLDHVIFRKSEATKILKDRQPVKGFITYEKSVSEWRKINVR